MNLEKVKIILLILLIFKKFILDPSEIGDKLDSKLINLCRIHDELCEIAKKINRMFSFQMLITMAYSFMFITAQCYFMYCALLGQVSDF